MLELHLSTPFARSFQQPLGRRASPGRLPRSRRLGRATSSSCQPEGGQRSSPAMRAATASWLARLRLPDPLERYLERQGRPGSATAQRATALAARGLSDRLRPRAGQRGDAKRRPPTQRGAADPARRLRYPRHTDHAHAGVSSPERRAAALSRALSRTSRKPLGLPTPSTGWGGRVIAVGTTVVRALESVARPGGRLTPGEGWTNLVVTAERGSRGRRRSAHRLARARGLPSPDAAGGYRRTSSSSAPITPRSLARLPLARVLAIAISSFPERPRRFPDDPLIWGAWSQGTGASARAKNGRLTL